MKRSSPLKRTGRLKTRTPIRRVSKRRRDRDRSYPEARRECWERAEGCCARCRMFVLLEVGHVHHLAGRGGSDPHRQDNLCWLCPACHAWTHDNPKAARAVGLMRSRLGGAA